MIEATDYPIVHPKQPPYYGAYPTGRHIILNERTIHSIFSPEIAEDLCKRRIGLMDGETLAKLQSIFEEECE